MNDPPIPGPCPPRTSHRRLLILFAAVFAVAGLAGSAAVAALAPELSASRCPDDQRLCGSPPVLAAPLVNLRTWRSPSLGFGLEYSADTWKVSSQDDTSVTLTLADEPLALTVRGSATARATPRDLLDRHVEDVRSNTVGLVRDEESARFVEGPNVGYRSGIGRSYVATLDAPQGLGSRMTDTVMAAGDRRLSLLVSVRTTELRSAARRWLMGQVDSVVNTIEWPAP